MDVDEEQKVGLLSADSARVSPSSVPLKDWLALKCDIQEQRRFNFDYGGLRSDDCGTSPYDRLARAR